MSRDRLFDFDADYFRQQLDAADDDMRQIIHQAISSTLSKLRRKSRTILSSKFREKLNIKKRDLDKHIKVKSGSRFGGVDHFEIVIKGMSISLAYFGAKQFSGNRVITRAKGYTNKRRSKFQGVEVEIIKGRKTRLTSAFIGASDSGRLMVLRRKGGSRYPIEAKAMISPASLFQKDAAFKDSFTEQIEVEALKLFTHELEYRLTKEGYL